MKKKIILVISIALAIAVCVGVSVYAGLGRNAEVMEGEKAVADEYVVRDDAEKTKTQIFYQSESGATKGSAAANDKVEKVEKELTYDKTWQLSEDASLDIYKDQENENVEYRYNGNEMTGWSDEDAYQRYATAINSDPITQEEAITIAKKHFLEIYGVDIDTLDLVSELSESEDSFELLYRQKFGKNKDINGEFISAKIWKDGHVGRSMNQLNRLNGFNPKLVATISEADMIAFGQKKAAEEFGERFLRYEIEQVRVGLNEEKSGEFSLYVDSTVYIKSADLGEVGKVRAYEYPLS